MTVTARRALLAERMARHGLGSRPASSPETATALTTALQAQDNLAARLGVRARATGVTDADVRRAIDTDRTLVRTWLMRGTIHQVVADDVRWLVRVVGPAVAGKFRTRRRRLGLTDDVLDRCVAALPALLADGPRNRHDIRAGLAECGITFDSPDPQVHTHMLVYASTLGLICRGPDRGRHATFVLLDDWLPAGRDGPHGDDALAELARRYFAAYSPATAADFATWSGLPAGRAIGLIRDELQPADVDGRAGYRLGDVAPQRGVRLLPAFDNYLIGYRDRAAILDPGQHPHIYQGGMIRPTVLCDGRVVAAWALDRARGRLTVRPFEKLSLRVHRDVAAEADELGRFLGRELSLEFAASPD
jgi:hypothetical protein